MDKPTARQLLDDLERKHGRNHAIVYELSMEDEVALNRHRAYQRDMHPIRTKRYWAKRGVDPESFGSADGYIPGSELTLRRIDAFMVATRDSKGRRLRTAVEVKISKADYRRDNLEKVRAWMGLSHKFVYLVPAGLIQPDELLDPSMGLWWWHAGETEGEPGRIEVVKAAKVNGSAPEHLPEDLQTRILWRLSTAEQKLRQTATVRKRKARRSRK